MDKIKLGFVPTRRSIFSAPDAIKYRGLTADRLREIGVDIVDIDDINDEGLLFDDSHIEPIVKKFRAEGVDGIMLCHANFGTEYVCARLARFDGDNGEYSLLLGNARGIDGPAGMGTYLWVEVDNLKRLEAKIVEGPYIHHCVAIHANVVPVLYEACKYIGIAPDLYDPIEEDVKAYLRGE